MTPEQFYDAIKSDAELLKADVAEGNAAASQVVTLYNMHVKCPNDPGALGLCMAAYEDWRQTREV